MAIRGVPSLRRLLIRVCDKGGSSAGARDFLREHLQSYKEKAASTDVVPYVHRAQEPFLRAEYKNGGVKTVSISNMTSDEIAWHADKMRTESTARQRKITARKMAQTKSVQGHWSPFS